MLKYGYLVVEGPHDVELVYRLLTPLGMKRVKWKAELDPFFHPLVPTKFPHRDDLLKRVPVPLFLSSDTHCVAIYSAIGDTRLVQVIEEDRENEKVDFDQLTGLGILLDSDHGISASQRYEAIKTGVAKIGLQFPDGPGEVLSGEPNLGAFVLPDNKLPGNLENLLIECAEGVYPKLLASAKRHVKDSQADGSFTDPKAEDLTKPPNFNKAVVSSIASVLKPGRAVQVSIQDNLWLRGDNLKLPRVQAVQAFLRQLLELI